MKSIKSLPQSLRPREKLLKFGPESLSLIELISVILITGNKNFRVHELAKKIAKLNKISKESLSTLNIGATKTSQILSAIEISHRLNNNTQKIISPDQIYAHSFEIIKPNQESLLCFYLNGRDELIKKEVVAVGPLNKVNLLPREIFSQIKELPVTSIILVHNHPSEILEPSKEDLLFTKRVQKSADLLGIKLLDHLIVTSKGWKRIEV